MAITGNIDRLYPEFLDRLSKWNTACGNVYYVTFGVRSYEDQKRLYELWKSGQRNIEAAPPGPTAKHMYGLAADLKNKNGSGTTYAHRQLAAKYGLVFNVSSEPWHVVHSNFRSLIDSGTVKPVSDVTVAAPLSSTSSTLPLLKPNMSGGPKAKALKVWLKANFPTYAGNVGTSDDWIGGTGSDSWKAMQEFARRTGLLGKRDDGSWQTLGAWGSNCWNMAAKHGFRA